MANRKVRRIEIRSAAAPNRRHRYNGHSVVSLHLRLHDEPGRRGELLEFLRAAIPIYEAPSGIRVRLLERLGVQGDFIEVIEYESNDDYAADQRRLALIRSTQLSLPELPVILAA